MMLRELKPIEIAEGALLADIAVVFQLLVIYIPIVGDIFRFPIFVLFTILVLRRGLYVGVIGYCVALFVAGILMGPTFLLIMVLQGAGGLYLGVTMKLRLRFLPLVLLGTTLGVLALMAVYLLTVFLFGVPIAGIIKALHHAYLTLLPIIAMIAGRIGLGNLWHTRLLPFVNEVATLGFSYWWAALYVGFWIVLLPVVALIYIATNVIARSLGYDVRPLPARRLRQYLLRRRDMLIKWTIRHEAERRQRAETERETPDRFPAGKL